MSERNDDGFGLVEVVVTTLIVTIAVAVLFGTLTRFFASSTTVQKESEVLANTRTTLELMTRDLRAANPLAQLVNVGDYDSQVAFTVYCANVGVDGCASNNQRPITNKYHRVRKFSDAQWLERVLPARIYGIHADLLKHTFPYNRKY